MTDTMDEAARGAVMKPSEILIAARAKIEDPENWIQGVEARAEDGTHVVPWSTDAVCWCAIGSIRSVVGRCAPYWLARGYLDKTTTGDTAEYNDATGRTHAEILAAFDRAIALADADEASA